MQPRKYLKQLVLDEPFLALLTTLNEAQVPRVLQSYAASLVAISPRGTARGVRRLTSAYVWSRGRYYHDAALAGPMRELVDALEAAQHDDGTYDQGNLHSPPDSAFTLQDLCLIWTLLHEDGRPASQPIIAALERIIRKAGPALASGGVHTPNHRWEVCAALARINRLWPHRSYRKRIDDWLGEGIDIDPEGQYSERSSIYAAGVTNPCLLTIAWLRGKDKLLHHVRRNLEATLYLLEPNGDVETVHSRRQDQGRVRDIWWYLLQYRELALHDRNGQFARVAKLIEERGVGELGDFLAEVLERPELGVVLPAPAALPDRYTRVFSNSGLARVRRGSTTASIFGGTDFHAIPDIASGLSTNPTFFKLRMGQAILDSVRISPPFFSTGTSGAMGLRCRALPIVCRTTSRFRTTFHYHDDTAAVMATTHSPMMAGSSRRWTSRTAQSSSACSVRRSSSRKGTAGSTSTLASRNRPCPLLSSSASAGAGVSRACRRSAAPAITSWWMASGPTQSTMTASSSVRAMAPAPYSR